MLKEVVDQRAIPSVISELEHMADEAGAVSLGAIHVLKNALDPLADDDTKRALRYEQSFSLPSPLSHRIRTARESTGLWNLIRELVVDGALWLVGRDRERFRDRCDRCFWKIMVPSISDSFGTFADRILNTINEAIINYAEYSFGTWAVNRKIHIQLFTTDDDLVYVIIRPSGSRLRSFDPLSLKARDTTRREIRKRGWGHTLLMKRALFLSFDREPRRRGMLVIIGPEDREGEAG